MFLKQVLSSKVYNSDSSNSFNKKYKKKWREHHMTDHINFINYQTFSQINLYIHKITKWQAFCGKKIKPPIHFE